MARKSLRDRNTAAIANEVTPSATDIEVRPEPAETSVRAEREPAARKLQSKKRSQTGAEDTARLGIYLTPDEFNDARASYLADWSNGGDSDTFARWIAGALDRHAARTADQRAARDRLRGRSEARIGTTRSFSIPTSTVQRMRAAITADQRAGRWPSDSAWCAEAISLAVDDAREANGGSLPTPPARLPNRLLR